MRSKSFIIGIIVTALLIIFVYHYFFIEPYRITIPTVSFPFKNTFDDQGNKLNVILISAPFRTEEDEQKYKEYKHRIRTKKKIQTFAHKKCKLSS